jgi:hypothetical protein
VVQEERQVPPVIGAVEDSEELALLPPARLPPGELLPPELVPPLEPPLEIEELIERPPLDALDEPP